MKHVMRAMRHLDQGRGDASRTSFEPRETPKLSGDFIEEAIPDPIPNSEVKLFGANGTARGICVGE